MSDDLISRSALKEEFAKHEDRKGYLIGDWENIIDNAPPVDAYTFKDVETIRQATIEQVRISCKNERPQGEWTTVKGIEGTYYCSECDGDIDWKSRYCPWCGAKMEVDYE